MSFPDLSTIILTCDSYTKKFGCIEHTVLCLLQQKNINQEIIIVDNSKNEENKSLLLKFIKTIEFPITLIPANTSIAKARNLGAAAAKGKIFVFIDEDALVLDENALNKIQKEAQIYAHGYGAKRAWTINEEWFSIHALRIKEDIKQNSYTFLQNNVGNPSASIRQKSSTKYLIRSFIGNFGYVERQAFEKVSGFPEMFLGYGLEDDAMCFLCYLNLGKPASLQEIETIHITHSISPVCYEDYQRNKTIYKNLLKQFGYKSFHVGDLLYPENISTRPILEELK